MPIGQTNNPLLQQVEEGVKQKVPAQYQNALQRTITAALTVMYSQQMHQVMVQQLTKPGDPVNNVAEGAAKLMAELYKQSKGTLPVQVMIPAAVIMMCEGMDFLAKANPSFHVNQQTVAQCAQDTTGYMLKVLGINQSQLHSVVAHGLHQATQQGQAAQGQAQQLQSAPSSGGIIQSAMGG